MPTTSIFIYTKRKQKHNIMFRNTRKHLILMEFMYNLSKSQSQYLPFKLADIYHQLLLNYTTLYIITLLDDQLFRSRNRNSNEDWTRLTSLLSGASNLQSTMYLLDFLGPSADICHLLEPLDLTRMLVFASPWFCIIGPRRQVTTSCNSFSHL